MNPSELIIYEKSGYNKTFLWVNFLPAPELSMQGNPVPIKDGFERIIEAFENVSYMGELRQRWVEINKLLKRGLEDNVSFTS